MNFIPYGRQDITDEDINEVVKTLKSDFITQGPKIKEFEESLSALSTAKYSFAVNSATSALHIACKALGVGEGDIVWTTPITFVASANCALYLGAKVDFVDIDEETFNMSAPSLREKLNIAKEKNLLPKVVIPVHMCGQSCDMKEIFALSKEFGFSIIEDASHAIGGSYDDNPIGSCKYSDITVFSFHPVKIITTGEGGACLTNNQKLAQKMELYRTHGVTRESDLLNNKEEGPWYYEQIDLGYNYRMTDIQASLGASQIKRIKSIIDKRNEVASYYDEKLKDIVITPSIKEGISAFHLYIIKVDPEKRKEIFIQLREAGIGVNVHYFPVHLQPYYKQLGFKEGDFPKAENTYKSIISIPMYPTITKEEIDYVCETIAKVVK